MAELECAPTEVGHVARGPARLDRLANLHVVQVLRHLAALREALAGEVDLVAVERLLVD